MRGLPALLPIALLFGCGASRVPCAGPAACGAAGECLANRCDERGTEPVARRTQRIVLEPTKLAVIAERATPAALPAAITFGSKAFGRSALYLKFPLQNPKRRTIEGAFVLLEPMPDTAVDALDVEVEVWRVRDGWDDTGLSWSDQPELGLPRANGLARGTPRQPLRVDVTEIVRYLDARAPHAPDYGLAVVAGGGGGHGASFATGAGGGRAPRLEIYLR